MQHDKGSLRFTTGMTALARHLGSASDGGSEGMASHDPTDVKYQNVDGVV